MESGTRVKIGDSGGVKAISFLWGRGLSEREKGQDKVKSNQIKSNQILPFKLKKSRAKKNIILENFKKGAEA